MCPNRRQSQTAAAGIGRRARSLTAITCMLGVVRLVGCSSSPLSRLPEGGEAGASSGAPDMSPGGASAGQDAAGSAGAVSTGGAAVVGSEAGAGGDSASTLKVFDQVPQFGIYVEKQPAYTPPEGVLMSSYGTVFLTKLNPAQKAHIGSALAARVTYHAQCDNYDRIGGIFFISLPPGQPPVEPDLKAKPPVKGDPRVEIVRFITPFSDYRLGALATYVFPDADISVYAGVLADSSRDVWVGLEGGSNPYGGDPCDVIKPPLPSEFLAVGFNTRSISCRLRPRSRVSVRCSQWYRRSTRQAFPFRATSPAPSLASVRAVPPAAIRLALTGISRRSTGTSL